MPDRTHRQGDFWMSAHDEEIWKPIPGYEGYYEASSLGEIRSVDRVKMLFGVNPVEMKGRTLRQKINKSTGYRMVILGVDGRRDTKTVHRLVAKTWIPNPCSFGDVNHKDGNKNNNSCKNLEWCTRAKNIQHAYGTGLNVSRKGAEVWTNKLTEGQVREIYHANWGTHREIAEKYGVQKPCVWSIKNRRIWRHLDMGVPA